MWPPSLLQPIQLNNSTCSKSIFLSDIALWNISYILMMFLQISQSMMSQWLSRLISWKNAKNWISHVNFNPWNWSLVVAIMCFWFSMNWQVRRWKERISISKSPHMKRLKKSKRRENKNKRGIMEKRMNRWLMRLKWLKKMKWINENRLGLQWWMKKSKLSIQILMKMTGKLNAKELPTNLRFNQKLTIKSGEPILNQPELVPIILKRSKLI